MDERRGYGLTKSWLGCLEKAKTMDLEVTVILEDDARLFDRAESLLFCDAEKRRSHIWSGMPKDTFITFLGGHTWNYANNTRKVHGSNDAKEDTVSGNKHRIQYRETIYSLGTYGFAVPRQSLDLLLGTVRGDIAHGWFDNEQDKFITNHLSPEKSWYNTAQKYNKKIYALQPLTVWHEGGFSNTWKRNRDSITGEGYEEEKAHNLMIGKLIGAKNETALEQFMKRQHLTIKGKDGQTVNGIRGVH